MYDGFNWAGAGCKSYFQRFGNKSRPSLDANGYMSLNAYGRKWLEHRLVATLALERELEAWEEVDHINGVRDDNRPENLQVVDRRTNNANKFPSRPHCLTCTCRDG